MNLLFSSSPSRGRKSGNERDPRPQLLPPPPGGGHTGGTAAVQGGGRRGPRQVSIGIRLIWDDPAEAPKAVALAGCFIYVCF
jgi:hypothetical protein